MDKAFMAKFGKKLSPPFNPYEDSVKYLISTYTIPYVGLTGYVGANPMLKGYSAKKVRNGLKTLTLISARVCEVHIYYNSILY